MKLAGLYYFYGDGVFRYPKVFDRPVLDDDRGSILSTFELNNFVKQHERAVLFGNYFKNQEVAKEFYSMVVMYRRSRDSSRYPLPTIPASAKKGQAYKDMSKEIDIFYVDYITGEIVKDQVMKVTGVLPQSDLYMRKAGAIKFREVLKTLLSHYGFARH